MLLVGDESAGEKVPPALMAELAQTPPGGLTVPFNEAVIVNGAAFVQNSSGRVSTGVMVLVTDMVRLVTDGHVFRLVGVDEVLYVMEYALVVKPEGEKELLITAMGMVELNHFPFTVLCTILIRLTGGLVTQSGETEEVRVEGWNSET